MWSPSPWAGEGWAPKVAGGDITTGLIHQWPMDNGNSSAGANGILDVKGTDHGTLTGGVTSGSTTGISGAQYATCRAFDGSTGFISLGSSPFDWNSGSFSFAGWAYITDVTTAFQVPFVDDRLANGTNMLYMFNRTGSGNGQIKFNTSGMGFLSPIAAISSATWFSFVFTNTGGGSGGTGKIYINGSSVAVTTASAADTPGQSIPIMGDADGSSPPFLNGRLYKLSVYSRALTSADALAFHNAG